MKPIETDFQLSSANREALVQAMSQQLRERFILAQTLREKEQIYQSEQETLFLELLGVIDAMEGLVNYKIPVQPKPISSSASGEDSATQTDQKVALALIKSLKSIQKKLLGVLQQREVTPIARSSDCIDFSTCRVVNQELRPELPPQTVTQVVRQGFRWGDRVLRPIEVIISKQE